MDANDGWNHIQDLPKHSGDAWINISKILTLLLVFVQSLMVLFHFQERKFFMHIQS